MPRVADEPPGPRRAAQPSPPRGAAARRRRGPAQGLPYIALFYAESPPSQHRVSRRCVCVQQGRNLFRPAVRGVSATVQEGRRYTLLGGPEVDTPLLRAHVARGSSQFVIPFYAPDARITGSLAHLALPPRPAPGEGGGQEHDHGPATCHPWRDLLPLPRLCISFSPAFRSRPGWAHGRASNASARGVARPERGAGPRERL